MDEGELATRFVRWAGARAALSRGWWLVTSLYLVVDAGLSAAQLVWIGVAQGVVSLLFEVPAGVVADTISRKWSIVASHVLRGGAMLATGLVLGFPALVVTQVLWGVAWTFSSGADVAWITDELDRPDRIDRVLTRKGRWEQGGAVVGLLGLGGLAALTSRPTAIVVGGAGMFLLGLYVVLRFPERNFTPTREQRWRASATIFRRGVVLARRDHEILLVFAATFLVNGAAEGFGRLFAKRLVDLGFPAEPDPIVWFTALGIAMLATGILALRVVEARIDGIGVARRTYAAACATGTLGVLVLALAPDDVTGSAGVLLAGGITFTVTRTVGEIWVNRRTTSDVRATVHSFLAQMEYLGEITCGIALGLLAGAASITVALVGSGALLAATAVLVLRSPADRMAPPVTAAGLDPDPA